MYSIHISKHYVIAMKGGEPRSSDVRRSVVTTLDGLKFAISCGWGPGVLEKITLTPRAAEYWKEYKAKTFPNESK